MTAGRREDATRLIGGAFLIFSQNAVAQHCTRFTSLFAQPRQASVMSSTPEPQTIGVGQQD